MRHQFGPYRFDDGTRELHCDEQLVPVQPLVATLLSVLLQHAEERVDTDVLTDTLWPETNVSAHSLEQLVHRARVALGSQRERLVTFPGRGYGFFGASVVESPAASTLSTEAERLWASLGAMAGPFRMVDARAMWSEDSVESLLAELMDVELVVPERPGWLSVRASSHPTPEAARTLHATWYLSLAADDQGGSEHRANVVAAGLHRAALGRGLQAVRTLVPWVMRTGTPLELQPVVLLALQHGASSSNDRAQLHRYHALLQAHDAKYDAALRSLTEAKAEAERSIDPGFDEVERLRVQALIADGMRDNHGAQSVRRRLVTALEQRRDPLTSKAQRDLSSLLAEAGRLREAMVVAQAALVTASEHGDPEEQLRCRGAIGEIFMRRGDPTSALPHFRAAARGAGLSPVHQAWWWCWLGEALAALGAVDEGLVRLRAAREAYRVAESRAGVVAVVTQCGRVLLRAGRLIEAERTLNEAMSLAKEADRPLSLGLARASRGIVSALRGEGGAWTQHIEGVDAVVAAGAQGVAVMVLLDWAELVPQHSAQAVVRLRALAQRAQLGVQTELGQRLAELGVV